MKKIYVLFILFLLITTLFSFNFLEIYTENSNNRINYDNSNNSSIKDSNINNFSIRRLDYGYRPRTNMSIISKNYEQTYDYITIDSNGVYMYIRDGEKFYHPVHLATRGYQCICSYEKTKDFYYYNLAINISQALINISNIVDNCYYFPYNFNWTSSWLQTTNTTLKAPWYSGMAQGELVGFFSRMYEMTKNDSFLEIANLTFNSLLRIKNKNNTPWVTFIDDQGFFWIEEYPIENVSCRVLNGFIFAIYGLYNYWYLTNNSDCYNLMQASITIIYHYLEDFRNVGACSYYGLGYKNFIPRYHNTHIKQIMKLYEITGDEYFYKISNALREDFYDE